MKSLKNRFWPIIAAAAVAGGLFVLFNAGGETTPAGKSRPPEPPVRPDVSAITLPTVDGGKFSTTTYKGKSPVLVSFFATWCEPCRQELPHLIALYKKYHAAGLQIAYITNEDKETVLSFRKAMSIPFPILLDADSTVIHEYGADSIPMLVVLDKQGHAAGGVQGYSEDQLDQVDRLTGKLLKE